MAMTKKERAEFDAAILRAEMLAALRWTTPVVRDLPPPPPGSNLLTYGWDINEYGSGYIIRSWSSSYTHGIGEGPSSPMSRSQGARALFSSRELALAALRHEVEKEAAAKLLRIDKGNVEERQ